MQLRKPNKSSYFQYMNQQYKQEWPQFVTVTIQEWKYLLKKDKYKHLVVDALNFLK